LGKSGSQRIGAAMDFKIKDQGF